MEIWRCLAQPDLALQIRSPLSPALRLMERGSREKRARHSIPWELRTVRRLDKRPHAEPEPSGRYWHSKALCSSNHQSGKLSRDPPLCFERGLCSISWSISTVQAKYRIPAVSWTPLSKLFLKSNLKDNYAKKWRKIAQTFLQINMSKRRRMEQQERCKNLM